MKSILNCNVCSNIECQATGICPVDKGLNASTDKWVRHLSKGEILFDEGGNADSVFFIHSGRIILFKKEESTEFKKISTIHAGKMLGMEAIYPYGYYIARAVAEQNTSVICMSRNKFIEISNLCSFASVNIISQIVGGFNEIEKEARRSASKNKRNAKVTESPYL